MKSITTPSDWIESTIEKECQIEIGGTPSRSNPEYWDIDKQTENLWVSIRDLSNTYISETDEYITDTGIRKSNAKKIKKGTVLMSFKLTIGRVGIAMRDLYTNEAIVALTPKNQLINEYLYFGLQHWDLLAQVDQAIKGSTLNKDKIKLIKIYFPKSKDEQEKIAKSLSTLEESVIKSEQLIAKYKSIKQGLMQDLFRYGIDEHGQIRSEKTHKFKDSSLRRIPDEWEVLPLYKLLKFISYGFTNPMPESEDGPYMVTAADINHGRILLESCRRTTHKAFTKLLTNKSRPNIGDVLITKDGTLGRVAIVDHENICINQSVAIMRFKEDVPAIFMKLLLESPYYQHSILKDSGGSTIKHIYITKIDKMLISLPKQLNEISQITNVIQQINKVITTEQDQLNKLKSIKSGLMQDLFTGKVRVTHLLN